MASTGINVATRRNSLGHLLPGQIGSVGGLMMPDAIRGRYWRKAALSLVLGTIVIGIGTIPAFAQGSPFVAAYKETTTPTACPPSAPAGAFCYMGTGTGPTFPPGDPNGAENF